MAPPPIVAITGASAGIGRATAVRLARDGASVAICARRGDLLYRVATEIEAAGGKAMPMVADVSSERDMDELVRLTLDRYQRLDVMICNAGFGVAGEIEAVSAEQMRHILDVNYLGTYYAARAALPVFRRQGAGHLIVVSSIVGKRGVPYMGAYSATKFAQVGLAESLRAELAGSDIHVTVVFPVSTETEFVDVMSRETGAPVARVTWSSSKRRPGCRRHRESDRPPGTRGVSVREVARTRLAERARPGPLRSLHQEVRA